jgi:hypothetical protein
VAVDRRLLKELPFEKYIQLRTRGSYWGIALAVPGYLTGSTLAAIEFARRYPGLSFDTPPGKFEPILYVGARGGAEDPSTSEQLTAMWRVRVCDVWCGVVACAMVWSLFLFVLCSGQDPLMAGLVGCLGAGIVSAILFSNMRAVLFRVLYPKLAAVMDAVSPAIARP